MANYVVSCVRSNILPERFVMYIDDGYTVYPDHFGSDSSLM